MPWIHIVGNLALLALFFGLGIVFQRKRWTAIIGMCLSVIIVLFGVLVTVRTHVYAALFPFPDLLFYSNLFPMAAALFIPCVFAFAKSRGQKIRMVVLCMLLFLLTLKKYDYHFFPLAHSARTYVDKNGICRQTSSDTCSAACLVTFLDRYGMNTTEAEAIELARTKRNRGTTNLGVYRALRIKSREKDDYRVVYHAAKADELVQRNQPAIVTVGLPNFGKDEEARAYGEKWSWDPGVFHDVVFLGKVSEEPVKVAIADPDFGLEHWPVEDFAYLYRGSAFLFDRPPENERDDTPPSARRETTR